METLHNDDNGGGSARCPLPDQSFPESVSEERDIHTDYNGCHHHCVKHTSYLPAHFSTLRLRHLSALCAGEPCEGTINSPARSEFTSAAHQTCSAQAAD
jgi:hypothetical protein